MSEHGASINVPPWNGEARHVTDVWRLTKGSRLAVCSLWTHPIGCEARVLVDGEMHRTEAGRNGLMVVELAIDWKARFQEKGWA